MMKTVNSNAEANRVLGSLVGLALGDAMGKPAESFSRSEIRKYYGKIEDLVDPIEGHPISHGLKASQVTDDTEQAMLLAKRLISSPGTFDQLGWVHDLLNWETEVKRRGVQDILGPSTKSALSAIAKGVPPKVAAKHGTTNGAAMRITPVGLVLQPNEVIGFVDWVETVSCVTHNTGIAISGASAVAAMISASVEGAKFDEAITFSYSALTEGNRRGYGLSDEFIGDGIDKALKIADHTGSVDEIADALGTSVESMESIPTAFGILRLSRGNVLSAAKLSANIGGDTDTIGAMACAMAGAATGMSTIPQKLVNQLQEANNIDFAGLADRIFDIRKKSCFAQEGIRSENP